MRKYRKATEANTPEYQKAAMLEEVARGRQRRGCSNPHGPSPKALRATAARGRATAALLSAAQGDESNALLTAASGALLRGLPTQEVAKWLRASGREKRAAERETAAQSAKRLRTWVQDKGGDAVAQVKEALPCLKEFDLIAVPNSWASRCSFRA